MPALICWPIRALISVRLATRCGADCGVESWPILSWRCGESGTVRGEVLVGPGGGFRG